MYRIFPFFLFPYLFNFNGWSKRKHLYELHERYINRTFNNIDSISEKINSAFLNPDKLMSYKELLPAIRNSEIFKKADPNFYTEFFLTIFDVGLEFIQIDTGVKILKDEELIKLADKIDISLMNKLIPIAEHFIFKDDPNKNDPKITFDCYFKVHDIVNKHFKEIRKRLIEIEG